MRKWLLLVALIPGAWGEPGITLLFDGRQPRQQQLCSEAKQYLLRLRETNQLEDFQLNISSADWNDPLVASLWTRQFGLTSQDLPALAVVQRQGNRFTVDNLLRRIQSSTQAAEGAFKCLSLSSPQLVREIQLKTGLDLTSQPSGAQVSVDGQVSGSTPCQVELSPGSHQIEVSSPNCHSYQTSVRLQRGQTWRNQVVLVPLKAYLRVESGSTPIQISLDGGTPSTTPCMMDVQAGAHRYQANSPGYYRAEGEFQVVPEQLTTLHIQLVPVRLRVKLGHFQASGYIGYDRRTSGSGWNYHEWNEPYEVFLDPAPLHQLIQQSLAEPAWDLVQTQPDCVLNVEIRSNKDQILGVGTLTDPQGGIRETVSAQRDMPFMTFDEQASAQLRAREVLQELLERIRPAYQKFKPQEERAPADRPTQIRLEVGPNS